MAVRTPSTNTSRYVVIPDSPERLKIHYCSSTTGEIMATPETAPDGTIEVKDSRTGKSYTLPVNDGAIRANDLKQIKTPDADDPGLLSYDPAFLNTASCRSAITF